MGLNKMSKELQNIQEIDAYLSGELTPENRIEFEKKLKEDIALQEELNATKSVIEGIQGAEFKKMLMGLHHKLFGNDPSS